jgi:hypothetical protein
LASGTWIPEEEYPFINALAARLVNGKVISDIYPYSVPGVGRPSCSRRGIAPCAPAGST